MPRNHICYCFKSTAVLIVDTELVKLQTAGTNTGLDLAAGAPMYFGGVPTTLKEESFKEL